MTKLLKASMVLLLVPFFAGAQKNSAGSVDSMVTQFTDELRAQGYVRIGYTMHYCPGYNRIWKEGEKCDYTDDYYQVYVFWEDSTASWVKKFDNCGPFSTAMMSTCAFFDYFEANSAAISSDEVAKFEYEKSVKGKTQLATLKSDHSCRREFSITTESSVVNKSFDMFDLLKKEGNNTNLHAADNAKLALVEWDKKSSKVIWKIEKKGGFVREVPVVEEESQASVE